MATAAEIQRKRDRLRELDKEIALRKKGAFLFEHLMNVAASPKYQGVIPEEALLRALEPESIEKRVSLLDTLADATGRRLVGFQAGKFQFSGGTTLRAAVSGKSYGPGPALTNFTFNSAIATTQMLYRSLAGFIRTPLGIGVSEPLLQQGLEATPGLSGDVARGFGQLRRTAEEGVERTIGTPGMLLSALIPPGIAEGLRPAILRIGGTRDIRSREEIVSGEPGLMASAAQRPQDLTYDQIERRIMENLGAPTDPLEFEGYMAAMPMSAQVVGEIANFGAMLASLRVSQLPRAGGRLLRTARRAITGRGRVGPTLKRARILAEDLAEARRVPQQTLGGRSIDPLSVGPGTLSLGPRSRFPVPGALKRAAPRLSRAIERRPGLTSALLGGSVSMPLGMLSAEDPDAWTAARSFITGAGAGYFFGTLMLGRPYGYQARATYARNKTASVYRQRGFVGSSIHRLRVMGAAHRFAPRLTAGYMAEAGLLGLQTGTARAYQNGDAPTTAMLKGMQMGVEWLGFDIMTARLGSTVRGLRYATDISNEITAIMGRARSTLLRENQVLGGAVAGALARPIGGAALGYGIAAATGTDPERGAIFGALAGGTLAFGGRSWSSSPLLPASMRRQLGAGAFKDIKLDKNGLIIPSEIFREAVEVVALKKTPYERLILKRAIQRDWTLDDLEDLRLADQEMLLYKRIAQLMPDERLPSEPTALLAAARAMRRLHEIREIRQQGVRQHYQRLGRQLPGQADLTIPPGTEPDRISSLLIKHNQEQRRLARLATLTELKRESILGRSRERLARESARQEARAQAAREGFEEAGRAERQLDFEQKINDIVNRRMAIARREVELLEPNEVFREISTATGESVDEVMKRLSEPFATPGLVRVLGTPQAIDELALLRSMRPNPAQPITSKILPRQRVTTELKRSLQGYERMTEELDNLLARADAGEEILPAQIDRMLVKLGLGGGVVRKGQRSVRTGEGIPFSIDFPFIGRITDTATAALRRARRALMEFKPQLAIALPVGATSLEKATHQEVEGGNIHFTDEQGRPGLAWLPQASMVASMAAVGMLLTKGFPVRYRGLAGMMRRFLMRQGKRKLGVREAREAIVMMLDDGTGSVVHGNKTSIPDETIRAARRGRAVVASMHNHPHVEETRELAKMGLRGATRRQAVLGASLVQRYPSGADVNALVRISPSAAETVPLAIVTPQERLTLATVEGVVEGPARSVDAATAKRVADDSARRIVEIARKELRAANVELADTGNNLANAIVDVGRYAELRGPQAVLDQMDEMYRGAGIRIFHDVTDDQFERLLATYHKRTTNPVREAVNNYAAESVTDPTFGPLASRTIEEGITLAEIRNALLGPSAEVSSAARRVAPRGARQARTPLPETITPQATSSAPTDLPRLREWGRRHGLNITATRRDGEIVYLAHDARGTEVARGRTTSELVDTIGARAINRNVHLESPTENLAPNLAPDSQKALAERQGYIWPIQGSIFGALAFGSGNAVYQMLREPDIWNDDEPGTGRALGIMALGAIGGAFAGAGIGRWIAQGMTPAQRRIFEMFTPAAEEILPAEKVASLIGKSGRKGSGGPTEPEFLKFPIEKQWDHYKQRLTKIANTRGQRAGKDGRARRDHFQRSMIKNTPTYMTLEAYDDLLAHTVASAQRAGFSETEAHRLWAGLFTRMVTSPYTRRIKQARMRRNVDLRLLAVSEAVDVFGPNFTLQTLRDIVGTASIITGPPAMGQAGIGRYAVKAIEQGLTPESEDWQKIIRANEGRFGGAGGQSRLGTIGGIGIATKILPPTHMKRILMQAREDPLKRGVAQQLLEALDSLQINTELIRVDYEDIWAPRLFKIFKGFSERDRIKVRQIIENPEGDIAREAITANPALVKAASQFRQMLDEVADELKIPKQARIQDYFPWIYSTRTVEQIKKAIGRSIDDLLIPGDIGFAEYKVFKQLFRRSNETPLGEIIEDPLEAGMIYLQGAMRKKYFDRVLSQFNGDFFVNMAKSEPILAGDIARLYMDAFGIPSKSHKVAMLALRRVGIAWDNFAIRAGLPVDGFFRSIVDRYFLSPQSANRLSRLARSFEFYSKLGFNLTSPLVNLTQLSNSGTDLGISNLFFGGMGGLSLKAQHKIYAKTGFLKPSVARQEKINMMREVGVFSDSAIQMLDKMVDEVVRSRRGIGQNLGLLIGTTGAGAFAGGLVLGEPGDRLTGALVGAGLGASAAVVGRGLLRWSLQEMKRKAIMPFQMAETVNRAMTAGAALRAARQAERFATASPATRARIAATEAVGQVGVGAGGGFLLGTGYEAHARPGEDWEAARDGAWIGGLAGAAAGIAGRRAPRAIRIKKELDAIQEVLGNIPHRSKLDLAMGKLQPPSRKEIEQWYIRQVLDQTQFRFGKEGRPAILRTLPGEIMGALQSYTLNQMEFIGGRMQSFWRSLFDATRNGPLITGPRSFTSAATTGLRRGEIDTRIFTHMALVAGAAGALSYMSAGLESDRGTGYWLGRIGFALVPTLNWNQDAETWQIGPLPEHIAGPFIGDLERSVRTMFNLMFNRKAQRQFDRQVDSLAAQLFTITRTIDTDLAAIARGADKLGLEAMADILRQQRDTDLVRGIQRPVGTMRGTSAGGVTGGGVPFGGSGFGGGFESGGFEGGGF